jgi:hypothetical protein
MLRPLLRPLLSQGVDAANTPIETALTEEQRKKATEHPGGLKSLAAFRGIRQKQLATLRRGRGALAAPTKSS